MFAAGLECGECASGAFEACFEGIEYASGAFEAGFECGECASGAFEACFEGIGYASGALAAGFECGECALGAFEAGLECGECASGGLDLTPLAGFLNAGVEISVGGFSPFWLASSTAIVWMTTNAANKTATATVCIFGRNLLE